MAKRKPKAKAAQWVKVDGQWFKATITKVRAKRWTRGLGECGGWEARPKCDMARRSEIHVTTLRGPLLKENI